MRDMLGRTLDFCQQFSLRAKQHHPYLSRLVQKGQISLTWKEEMTALYSLRPDCQISSPRSASCPVLLFNNAAAKITKRLVAPEGIQ